MDAINSFISNSKVKGAGWLLLRLCWFLPLLGVVAAVNIAVDPSGLYTDGAQERRIAKELSAKERVSLWKDMDDRLLQKYMIEQMPSAPDTVILGSSHTMWLGKNVFPHGRTFNHSVYRAVLADYLGILEGYADKGAWPSRVVFELNPELLWSPGVSEQWLSLKKETDAMLERLGASSQKIRGPFLTQARLNIFSFSYFQKSLSLLLERRNPNDYFRLERGSETLLNDGRRLWAEEFRSRGQEEIHRLMARGRYQEPYARRSRQGPDQELESVFGSLVRYLKARHIKVTFCMLPLHPEQYQRFLESRPSRGIDLEGFERYYRGLAKRWEVEMAGSFDPAACGIDGDDFYDEEHIRNEVVDHMFQKKESACLIPWL